MQLKKTRLLGSDYIGLFAITSDELCLIPHSTDDKTTKLIETTLDVKTIKTSIYESALIAVFAKMNNKEVILPSFTTSKEIEAIEKEIKVRIIETENAIGNLMEINDEKAILSNALNNETIKQISKSNLELLQTNIAKISTVGASILLTNRAFIINPNSTSEEIKKIQQTLNIKGGSSTANTGDSLIRNSVIANTKGILVGEKTTGHEMNRIEETLNWEE